MLTYRLARRLGSSLELGGDIEAPHPVKVGDTFSFTPPGGSPSSHIVVEILPGQDDEDFILVAAEQVN